MALVAGLIGLAPSARAADDSRFYGAWEITFPYDGQTLTLVSVHSASGYKNYVLLPEGSMPVGQEVFPRPAADGPRRPTSPMIPAHTSSLITKTCAAQTRRVRLSPGNATRLRCRR